MRMLRWMRNGVTRMNRIINEFITGSLGVTNKAKKIKKQVETFLKMLKKNKDVVKKIGQSRKKSKKGQAKVEMDGVMWVIGEDMKLCR